MIKTTKNQKFYNTLLGFFIKKGNKHKAKKIIDKTFLILQKKTKKPLSLLIGVLFFRLRTVVEVKKIKTGKRINFIPFIIGPKRRIFLSIKWLKQAIKEDKRKVSFSEKLATEILNIFYNKPCISLTLKKENTYQAFSNRSNIYYRW